MSVTVDANVLLYASDEESRFNQRATELVGELAAGPGIVHLFWPTVIAYLRLATHPAVFSRPLPREEAIANVESLVGLAHIQTPGEVDRFWPTYRDVANDADARGNVVSDAHLVALMVQNGVRTIWTHDRDFRRFPQIEVRDPF